MLSFDDLSAQGISTDIDVDQFASTMNQINCFLVCSVVDGVEKLVWINKAGWANNIQ